MNIYRLLENAARRYPDKGAVFHGTAQHSSYAELHLAACALGAGMAQHAARGERIVLASKNCPEYLELLFGIWAAGLVVAPVNAKLHPREMADVIDDAEAKLIFVEKGLAKDLGDLVGNDRLIVIGGPAYQAMRSRTAIRPVDVLPTDIAWLFYTSGTTGRSKGAMLSHRNLMAMAIGHLADMEDVSVDDAIVHAAPLSHGSGLYVLPYLARSARHIVPVSAGFDATEFLQLCAHHGRCGAFMAPTMVQRLRLEAGQSAGRPEGLRSIIYGGGPMYLEEIKLSLAQFGPIFRQLYGQGESPMTITAIRQADFIGASDAELASVGYARSGVEVRVVDAEGGNLPAHELGEVVCRGDVVMSGYWRNPEATATTIRNGWLYTGDIGSLDERGMLTLRDRSKDVIISGGSNIYPREVEEVLLTHPDIREVCVVGQSDPEWGEVVVAFIVIEPGETIDDEALDRHCLDRIARFKRPKRYAYVDELPKSAYGKVLKRVLADRLKQEAPSLAAG